MDRAAELIIDDDQAKPGESEYFDEPALNIQTSAADVDEIAALESKFEAALRSVDADTIATWPDSARLHPFMRADLAADMRQAYRKVMGRHVPRLVGERAQDHHDALVQGRQTAAWPAPLDLAGLSARDPEQPHFIIADWLPAGYATLLAGHGGVGKSGIALYLVVCMALGLPFFGMKVERRRVVYLSCEDRENVLHWRLSRICAHLGVCIGQLAGWLDIVDLVGHDCVLWERDPKTGHTFTFAYGQLDELVRARAAEVLVVDGVSDTFGGNENARAEVKRFINSLVALVPADTGAVLLLGHIAKPSASAATTSEGYSGSTGWHNGVRARWYLYPETSQRDDGDKERTGDLILELQKSNLGRTDLSMRFAWDESAHLFLGREITPATALDRAHRDRIEQRDILAALKACAEADPVLIVPAATTGKRTAFHALSARREFPETLRGGKPETRRFWRHIEILRGMGAVNVDSHRMPDRHYINQLVITAEGLRACGE